tara:strand:+ start:81 stop:635 length:555 start_codon:yes stop_codon:yes gene_type:complete
MLIHEDSIQQSDSLSKEELAILQASKDAAKLIEEIKREVTPNRVAMAGLMLLLFIGLLFSGWYWVIPRDSVTVETLYMQRGSHIVMSEIHNTGSREITDVSLDVRFQSIDGEILETMNIEVDSISAHSSLAGNDLEMQIAGYTVWDLYVIAIEIVWTDYNGETNTKIWTHEVGEWVWEEFKDSV